MHQILVNIGGRPGIDCRGFCCYCYHRHVQQTPVLGCRHCPPDRIGCTYCSTIFRKTDQKFKPLWFIGVKALVELMKIGKDGTNFYIQGEGDPSCYPKFRQLIEMINKMGVPFSIGYTTGKGFDDPSIGHFLVDQGLSSIVFSIFSVDPMLLRYYIHDPSPEVTLSVLEYLCGESEVFPNIILVPGVNDGDHLDETCHWLEEKGAKGLIIFRFANVEEQGIIRGNAPIINNQRIHSITEFNDIVSNLSRKYNLRIDSMPLWDSKAQSPFIITYKPDYLDRLPRVFRQASIITGAIAAPYIQHILETRGGSQKSVIPTKKDIACLITIKDLKNIDLSLLEKTVIIPGRALVHDKEAKSVLCSDGVSRVIVRGPDTLTIDQMYWDISRKDAIHDELANFTALINLINEYGV